ncbi:MAG: hypothetical protein ACSHX8_13940 [Opitutaceae bacterium]
MITVEKLKEWTWCDGDSDGYSRSGRWKKNILTDEEWKFIDRMVSEIGLIKKNLVTESFKEAHEKKKDRFDSIETYEILKQYKPKS